MRGTVRKCLLLLDNDKRGRWLALIALNIAAGAIEAVGAILILATLALLAQDSSAVDIPIVGSPRDRFPDMSPDSVLLLTCALVGTFFILRGVLLLSQTYLQARIAHNAGVRLSSRLLRHYLDQPWTFHASTNSSILIRNATNAVQSVVGETFVPLIAIVSESIVVLGLVVVLLIAAPLATIPAAVFVAGVAWSTSRIVRSRLRAAGVEQLESGAVSYYTLQQALQGARDVKLLHREDFFSEVFDRSRARWARSNFVNATLANTPRIAMETMFVVGLVTFAAMAGAGQSDEETLALFGLFAYSVLRILPAVNRIVYAASNLQFGGASVDTLYEELVRMEQTSPREPDSGETMPFDDTIVVRGLTYRYPTSPRPVLQDVDVEIRRGQFIGVVGPTGSGKTTFLDLLIGLLEPESGEVLVDGRAVHDDVRAWQRNIGVVSQAVYLLDDTLRHNIAFGVPEELVDDARLASVVHAARLEDLVRGLPDGLETTIGEAGARLSGGQRQRVAIARALYGDPAVIVFDEGTSALDTVTEAEVMEALETLRDDRTIIAVAHRLTTLRSCDSIVLLVGGEVVDTGTYDELLARSSTFRRMAS